MTQFAGPDAECLYFCRSVSWDATTWGMCSGIQESPVTWLFVQQHIQADSKRKHQISILLDLCEGNPSVTGGFYCKKWVIAGIIFCMHPANERWRYIVTSSLIGWAHRQNNPCIVMMSSWKTHPRLAYNIYGLCNTMASNVSTLITCFIWIRIDWFPFIPPSPVHQITCNLSIKLWLMDLLTSNACLRQSDFCVGTCVGTYSALSDCCHGFCQIVNTLYNKKVVPHLCHCLLGWNYFNDEIQTCFPWEPNLYWLG